jgi:hypothetical protein
MKVLHVSSPSLARRASIPSPLSSSSLLDTPLVWIQKKEEFDCNYFETDKGHIDNDKHINKCCKRTMSFSSCSSSSFRLLLSCMLLLVNHPGMTVGFVVVHPPIARMGTVVVSSSSSSTTTTTLNSKPDDSIPTECFIVNQEAVLLEGELPEVVCTNAPEEYAWFNGIDKKALIPTDTTSEENLECVEKASPRGLPEWECHPATTTSTLAGAAAAASKN